MSLRAAGAGMLFVVVVWATVGTAAGGDRTDGKPAGATSPQPIATTGHRMPSLLSAATPEERARLSEERKRISSEAAAAGTDPTAIVGYYQLSYGHNAFAGGVRTNSVSPVVRLPLTPNWFVQVTLPYVWADLNRRRGFDIDGTSDLDLRTGGRLYASEYLALFAGLDASFPSASEKQLGSGKYTLGPGVAVAAPLPRLHSLSYLLLGNFNSIGGDPSRRSINYLQVQAGFNTFWTPQWWTLLLGTWATDWNNHREPAFNLLGQVGFRFDRHWNVFVGAGGGTVGQRTLLGQDWNVQAGVRWVFEQPLIAETLFGGPGALFGTTP